MRIELPFFLVESWRKDEHLLPFREQFRFDRVGGALDARKGILVFEMIATDVEWDHSKHRLEFRPPEIQDDFAAPTILEHAARAEQSLPHHELCEPKWAVKIRKPAPSPAFPKSKVLIRIPRTQRHGCNLEGVAPVLRGIHPHHAEVTPQARHDVMAHHPARAPLIRNEREDANVIQQRLIRRVCCPHYTGIRGTHSIS